MSITFAMNDTVRWQSQAAGGYTIKAGTVVAVVPAGKAPNVGELARKLNARSNYGGGGTRDHESYVVSVPQGKTGKAKALLYWPVVSGLRKV